MSELRLNRRNFLKIAAGVIGTGVLASCAAPPATPVPTAEPAESAATEAAGVTSEQTQSAAEPSASGEGTWKAPSQQDKTYVMWGLDYAPHVEKYKLIQQAFDEKTGAKGTVEPQAWPLETKVLAALAAGTAPDIACVMGKMLAPLVREGALLPFDDIVYKTLGIEPENYFTPGAILPYCYDGKYYGVPTEDNAVASFLISREDLIEKAGAESLWPPLRGGDPWFADYAEMWSFATKMQQSDSAGNVSMWGYSGKGWELQQFAGVCRMLGHKWWDLEQQKFAMDADAAVQAIQILVGDPIKAGIETNLPQSGQDSFAQGKVAMARGNMGIFPEAAKNDIPYTGCIAPPLKRGDKPLFTGEGGWGFILPKGTKGSDVAVELAKFMSTVEGNSIYMTIYGGILPPIYAERDLPFWQEARDKGTQIVRSWFPAQELTEYYPEGLGYYGPYETAYEQVIATVRTGEATAKEAANQMQQLFTDAYDKWTEGE